MTITNIGTTTDDASPVWIWTDNTSDGIDWQRHIYSPQRQEMPYSPPLYIQDWRIEKVDRIMTCPYCGTSQIAGEVLKCKACGGGLDA